MTTPKKPLSKTESAIQLGNQMMGARGGGTRAGLMKKFKKLLKIGEKQNKISSSSKIKEVRTRPVKALQNQKVDKSPKTSDKDAYDYNQPRGHGVGIGPRAKAALQNKHPITAKIADKAKPSHVAKTSKGLRYISTNPKTIPPKGKTKFKIQPKGKK